MDKYKAELALSVMDNLAFCLPAAFTWTIEFRMDYEKAVQALKKEIADAPTGKT